MAHATIYQEAGFLATEFFWIDAAVEHHWPIWTYVGILALGIIYARYGGGYATDIHNKSVPKEPRPWLRVLIKLGLVSAVLGIPGLIAHTVI
jgi:hypothetical protein